MIIKEQYITHQGKESMALTAFNYSYFSDHEPEVKNQKFEDMQREIKRK